MIRDPSDGSVREAPKAEAGKTVSKPMPGPDTGIRQPTRTDAQQRLEASREWLKQYRKAVDDANSMNDKGEVTNGRGNEQGHSTAGRSGDDQRPAES